MTSLGTYNPHICTNLVPGYTTTVSSTTPITLTSTSNNLQHCTGTASQAVILPPSVTLQNGFTYLFNNQSTGTASVYAAGPNNGTAVAGYTFPLTTITIGNINGTFAGGGGTFNILTTTGLQTITYTSYAAGVFTFASQGTGSALTGAVVSTSISLIASIASNIERKFVVTDFTGGNTNGNVNGWFAATGNNTVLDNNATPKYPTSPQTEGIWYGTGAKLEASTAASMIVIGNNTDNVNQLTTNTIMLGHNSVANAAGGNPSSTNSIIIGNSANCNSQSSVCIGNSSTSSGSQLVIGYNANAFLGGHTVGASSYAGDSSISFGYSAMSNGIRNVTLGYSATTSNDGGITIGSFCTNSGSGAVSIGYATSTSIDNIVQIGRRATAIDAAHGFALTLPTTSYNPGSFGITLGTGVFAGLISNAVFQLPLYTHLYNTTATANTVTTLLSTSAKEQYFTGSSNQGVVLPVTTTLNNVGNTLGGGFTFEVINRSTGTVSVGSTALTTLDTAVTLPAATITVASVTSSQFASSGVLYLTTAANGLQFVAYTAKATVTTDSTASPQTLPPGGGLFNVTSAAGLLAAGSVLVQTVSNGLQIVNYTSIIGNQLQGCTGGVGTTTASGSVTQSTFTGCTGGTGSAIVGSNVGVAVAIVEPQFRANLNLIDQSGATGVAGWYAEVFTLGQALYGLNSLAIGKGAASSTTLAANEITLGNSAVTAVRSFGAFTFLSDARDKKDIKPIEAGMDFVSKLQPVNFTWDMRDGGKRDQPDCGFIAQQLQQAQQDTNTVIPGLVYDANPEQLQIAPTKLLPVIIKALQEANNEIKELKRLIDELRSR